MESIPVTIVTLRCFDVVSLTTGRRKTQFNYSVTAGRMLVECAVCFVNSDELIKCHGCTVKQIHIFSQVYCWCWHQRTGTDDGEPTEREQWVTLSFASLRPKVWFKT